jgi:hypothetical protein
VEGLDINPQFRPGWDQQAAGRSFDQSRQAAAEAPEGRIQSAMGAGLGKFRPEQARQKGPRLSQAALK